LLNLIEIRGSRYYCPFLRSFLSQRPQRRDGKTFYHR